MDDNTKQALTMLAEKLGITGEYIWGVLLKQAYISLFTQILLFSIVALVIYVLVRFAMGKMKTPKATDVNPYPVPAWGEEDRFVSWILIATGMIAILIWSLVILNTAITVLANPEYWALQKILNAL